jgi:hypothetical protein
MSLVIPTSSSPFSHTTCPRRNRPETRRETKKILIVLSFGRREFKRKMTSRQGGAPLPGSFSASHKFTRMADKLRFIEGITALIQDGRVDGLLGCSTLAGHRDTVVGFSDVLIFLSDEALPRHRFDAMRSKGIVGRLGGYDSPRRGADNAGAPARHHFRWEFEEAVIDPVYDASRCLYEAYVRESSSNAPRKHAKWSHDRRGRASSPSTTTAPSSTCTARSASGRLARVAGKLHVIEMTTALMSLGSVSRPRTDKDRNHHDDDAKTLRAFDVVLRFLAGDTISSAKHARLLAGGILDALAGAPRLERRHDAEQDPLPRTLSFAPPDSVGWAFEGLVIDRALAAARRFVGADPLEESFPATDPKCSRTKKDARPRARALAIACKGDARASSAPSVLARPT